MLLSVNDVDNRIEKRKNTHTHKHLEDLRISYLFMLKVLLGLPEDVLVEPESRF